MPHPPTDITNYRADIKRNKVLSILENDTAAYEQALKKLDLDESIGIDLAAIILNPNSDANMTLQEGDIISIPKAFNTVQVRGEVLNPSKVKYSSGLSLGKYIGRAGGFSSAAKKSKSYVIYANGSSQRTTTFLGFGFIPKYYPELKSLFLERQKLLKPVWLKSLVWPQHWLH